MLLSSIYTEKNATEYAVVAHSIVNKKALSNAIYNPVFNRGFYYLYVNELAEARQYFSNLVYLGEQFGEEYAVSLSLLGLTEILLYQSNGGLARCYNALKEKTNNADLYFFIAYGEYLLGNRKRAIKALRKCKKHKYAQQLLDCMGQRKKERNKQASIVHNTIVRLFRKNNDSIVKLKCGNIFDNYLSAVLDVLEKKEA